MSKTTVGRMAVVLALVLALGAAGGCTRVRLEGAEPTVSSKQVPLGGAESLDVTVDMPAGELTLDGGAAGALDAEFRSGRADWIPEVRYDVREGTGHLDVSTEGRLRNPIGINTTYAWDVRLNNDVPVDLTVTLGAGESRLDLSDLDISRLRVTLGAGESVIDLSGEITQDLTADVTSGVGEARIIVPKDVGVLVVGGQDGIGSLVAAGFSRNERGLVNDAYDSADVVVTINVRRGIGETTIETAE